MKSRSVSQIIERSQPWLGTLITMQVAGLPPAQAHEAISDAFEEVALVHRLMGFHDAASDVSRLNREAASRAVDVHPFTLEVLRMAAEISRLSDGCFDISVGAELVRRGMLPGPAQAPAAEGDWQDIELNADGRVRFRRPLCIDLGGIAKGYAVDRAIECLRWRSATRAVVNAGGDIRVHGQRMERIALDPGFPCGNMPVLELADGAVASSSGYPNRKQLDNRLVGPHVHGVDRSSAATDRFVCVLADRCMVADALTKVVMVEGQLSEGCLREFGAVAWLHDHGGSWQCVRETSESS